jgi:putative ABC transport system permease protein
VSHLPQPSRSERVFRSLLKLLPAPREHLEVLAQDLRFALRTLRKSPLFTLVAILTLALGIGGNTVLFSVVDQVLLRPLPYPRADELVRVWASNPGRGWRRFEVSSQDFDDWRSGSRSFAQLAVYSPRAGNLTGGGDPLRVDYVVATASLWPLLGVEPLLGRTFTAEEDAPGRGEAAVVSYGFWRSYLGGDRGALGRHLTVGGEAVTVVGVMPPGFGFPDADTQLYKPFGTDRNRFGGRGAHWLDAVGRLAPGVSLATAQAEISTLAEGLAREYPDTNTGYGVLLEPLHEVEVGEARPALLVLWAAVGLILLIAAANLAGLLLARGIGRRQELALRAALGARRPRLLRQLLSESLLLALAGGACGLALAYGALAALPATALGATLPRIDQVSLDLPVLAFCLGLSLATGLLFGLLPALTATRTDPAPALKEGGGRGGGRDGRSRAVLVVAEVALAVVVLVGAGLLLRSFARLLGVDPGFDPQGLLTLRLEPPQAPLPEDLDLDQMLARLGEDRSRAVAFYDELLGRLAALPGVRAAAAINRRPLAGTYWNSSYTIAGRPRPQPGQEPDTYFRTVTPGYFTTLGIPLVAGRVLGRGDVAGAPGAVVISRAMAAASWGDDDPLGARITFDDPDEPHALWYTVVGVVGDVRASDLETAGQPMAYATFAQSRFGHFGNWGMDLVVRTAGDPLALAAAVRGQVRALDPTLPAFAVRSMAEVVGGALAARRVNALLVGLLAAVALGLAAVGLYGVIAYSVSRRRHEIGLRMALGATPGAVVGRVVGRGMALVAAGVALGLAGAALATRLLASLLYGVGATDPATYAAVALLLAAVALLACAVPARRAARVDPAAAFRAE